MKENLCQLVINKIGLVEKRFVLTTVIMMCDVAIQTIVCIFISLKNIKNERLVEMCSADQMLNVVQGKKKNIEIVSNLANNYHLKSD